MLSRAELVIIWGSYAGFLFQLAVVGLLVMGGMFSYAAIGVAYGAFFLMAAYSFEKGRDARLLKA